jgi:phosphoribosyl-ATP pyrophosphohydrolase/phosphoribosyl-AMP cyclohydrolase
MRLDELQFDQNGLLPVVVQHHRSGQVLMVAFANRDAVEKSTQTGHAWFFSRRRQQLWEKGETSGHYLELKGMRVDCDADTLIYECEPLGPTCHTGAQSCFFNVFDELPRAETNGETAGALWEVIRERQAHADPSTSYVARLLAEGVDLLAQKVGEEAIETVIAAKNGDRTQLANELADLWFHTFVLLAQQGMAPEDVWAVLRARRR